MVAGPLARWRPLLFEPFFCTYIQRGRERSAYVGVKFNLPHKGGRRLRVFEGDTEEDV